jgi:hypothetical protein
MRAAALLSMLMLAGAAGCSQYHYYDFDVSVDSTFQQLETSQIQFCHLYVTGAETWDGLISNSSGNQCLFSGHHLGNIEYSSLADSGTLHFKFDVLDGVTTPKCITGEGTMDISVGATTTTQTFLVNRTAGCVCGQSCGGSGS